MNVSPAAASFTAAVSQHDDLPLAPSLERRRLQCYAALIVADIVSISLGYLLIGVLYGGSRGYDQAIELSLVALPVFLAVALYNGAYSIVALRNRWRGIMRAEVALLIANGMVVLFAFYTKSSVEYSRVITTGGLLATALVVALARVQMGGFVRRRCGANVTNELLIDDGGPEIDLPGAIRVSAGTLDLIPDLYDPHALDRIGMVLRNIDRVIVSCPRDRRVAWAMMLKGANIEGEVLDDQVVRLGAQGARVIGSHGLLLVAAGPLGLRDRVVKRGFDLLLASAAILVLSPLLLVVAIAIKLEDGGPVLFVQRRMGRGNRFFNMYKFRSMTDKFADREGAVSTTRHDRRVTRVGRLIRRTSMDELPQLINVLLGDMSLVGPRPHAIGSHAGEKLYWEVDPRYWQRHCLKPGLSGLAQVRGLRGATDHESDLLRRLQSDLEYLEGWTIWRDLRILLLTLRVLVHDRAF